MDLRSLVRPSVLGQKPYAAGTTVAQARAKYGLAEVIKLSSNENPLGPSPRAMAALERIPDAHAYVDDEHPDLRERLGRLAGFDASAVIVGHGSNDVLMTLFGTFVNPGDEIVLADPTFSLFVKDASLFDGVPVKVPLREGVHDLDAMLAAVTPRTKMMVVCEPNNPTGTMLERTAFARFVDALPARVLLLIDQAYREFMPADGIEGMEYVRSRPGTIVTRTMSKLYGLASLRFGYAVARPELIEYMQRVRLPFNVSRPSAMAALAALDDDEFVARTLASNEAGKAYLAREFARLGLFYYPTAANFYAVRVPVSATEAYEALLARGIVVRSGDGLGMPGFLRITIGTRRENEALIAAFDALAGAWQLPAPALA